RGERAKPHPLLIEHFNLADASIGVRVKLDLRLAGAARACLRNLDNSRCAADAEHRALRRNLHVTVLGHKVCDESDSAACDLEQGSVRLSALLIDEVVHDDACIGGEAESGFILERDAKG